MSVHPGLLTGTRRIGAVTTWAAATGPAALAELPPAPTGTLAFLSGTGGLVGWGEYARLEVTGADAADRIGQWFAEAVAELDVDDRVGVPGSGPLAFVSLGFDAGDTSVAVIPEVVVGSRPDGSFRTVISRSARSGAPSARPAVGRRPITAPGRISYADDSLSVAGFTAAVEVAVERIRRGDLQKVVLAHDLRATAAEPIDERYLLRRLTNAYPGCWTYAVAGLVGASPEMLLSKVGETIGSRVLAGTAWAGNAGDATAIELLASAKDQSEHDFAVRSVVASLAAVAADLVVPPHPRALELANLTHLATDITGRSTGPATALELAARLHPTAAVGGAPRSAALSLIRELEPAPRGRYAAPVGWLDSRGDGEFAIALRGAQVSGRSARLVAGCGIVADSRPAVEAREAQVKMVPMRDALEG